ncbi:MAG: hypothetical protein ABFD62_07200 [Syntrophaceae bacterium]
MIVFCEECGQMFIIEQESDPVKVFMFRCGNCDEMVRVEPPGAEFIDKVAK